MNAKQIIKPLQEWLSAVGRCFGCGSLLVDGEKRKFGEVEITVCNCERVFFHNETEGGFYRSLKDGNWQVDDWNYQQNI